MVMKNPKLRNDMKKMQGCAIGETANHKCKARVRVVGLPFELTKWLEKKQEDIKLLNHLVTTRSKSNPVSTIEDELKVANNFLIEFEKKLVDTEVPNRLIQLIKRYLICFGPKRCGPNMMINQLIEESDGLFEKFQSVKRHFCFEEEKKVEEPVKEQPAVQEDALNEGEETKESAADSNKPKTGLHYHQRKKLRKRRKFDGVKKWFKINEKEILSAITAGFEYTTNHGPLLEEDILGSCFVIDEIEVIEESAKEFLVQHKEEFDSQNSNSKETVKPEENEEDKDEEDKSDVGSHSKAQSSGAYSDTYGPITGQIMSLISKLCRKSFLNAEPRIVEGMYKCELQVSSENLGKIYAVIGKHRAKTLEEELQENSELFLLKILIPVYESFSFSDQIRDRECGIPHPQLVFYGWDINAMDPFHVSMTDDELEEFGDQELPPNQVKIMIDKIRKRKGLVTEKKLVEDGGKQSTLSRKK